MNFCAALPALAPESEDLLLEVVATPVLSFSLPLGFPPPSLPDAALDLPRLPDDLDGEEEPIVKLGLLPIAVLEAEEAAVVLGCSNDCRDTLKGCRCIFRLVP